MKQSSRALRVPYALAVFGREEVRAVARALETAQIVAGKQAAVFERRIARLFGKRYGILVNSGSSANLLAVEALGLPAGAEVITPALTFATTVAPLVKRGLVPAFVDVLPGSYLLDIDQVGGMITKKTRAIMAPSLFGNVPDLSRLAAIARKHRLILIEDSCDTLGATIAGKPTGRYSDISTTSFYASHIITAAGEGGMVLVNDPALARRIRILSGWGRRSALNETEDIDERLKGKIGHSTYDTKFIFSEIGYNMRTTDIAAAFGLAQLVQLRKFMAIRQRNFRVLSDFFRRYEKFFILPKQTPGVKTSWLAFPLAIRPGAPFARNDVVRYLERANIQTRPVFAGNILRQPGFRRIRRTERRGGYPNADAIMANAFVIGCHHGLGPRHLNYMKKVFRGFIAAHAPAGRRV